MALLGLSILNNELLSQAEDSHLHLFLATDKSDGA